MSRKKAATKTKYERTWWLRRNEARSTLQRQHAVRTARQLAEQEAAALLLGEPAKE